MDIDGHEVPDLDDFEDEDLEMKEAGSHTETEMEDYANPEQ